MKQKRADDDSPEASEKRDDVQRLLAYPVPADDCEELVEAITQRPKIPVSRRGEVNAVLANLGGKELFSWTRGGVSPTSIATLTSPYAQAHGQFGLSVAISEGDPTLVVGAPFETASGVTGAGHAYIF